MNNRLSHSSVNKYMECGQKYKYHYIDKLRSNVLSSALLFGTAIDKAVEVLVGSKDLSLAKQKFDDLWWKQEINKVETELQSSPDIIYSTSDYDEELLNNNDINDAYELNHLKKEKGWENLSLKEKSTFNYYAWKMAKVRGHLMLETVYKEILPNIIQVLSTQEQINLDNGSGDTIIGYTDLVAKYKGYEEPIVFDFKTSTRPYEKDAVLISPQLSLYMHALSDKYKTRKAGFIVLSKTINKNRVKTCKSCGNVAEKGSRHKTCNNSVVDQPKGASGQIIQSVRCNGEWDEVLNPSAFVTVLIDDIPEAAETLVIDNADAVNISIKNGVFIKNFGNCHAYNKPCEFYNLCWHGKMDGLVKSE